MERAESSMDKTGKLPKCRFSFLCCPTGFNGRRTGASYPFFGLLRVIFTNYVQVLNEIDQLNRSGHLLSFIPGWVFEDALERNHSIPVIMNPHFDYQSFMIDIQEAADAFEASYLIPNQTPSEEDCEN